MEKNKYQASIIDMDVKTENRGTTVRMFFTVSVMPDMDDGKIDRVALTNKINAVTEAVTKSIQKCNNVKIRTEIVMDGKTIAEYCKDK